MARVWAYSIMRNESVILPYWLRHYQSFCDRIIVYDDHSDDDTVDIASNAGAIVREYPGNGLDDQSFVELAEVTYPEARGQADYIVWVDADEFLYHHSISARLEWLLSAGIQAPSVQGYNMLSEALPSGAGQIYEEITTGIFDTNYSKQVIVAPEVLIHWRVGRHQHDFLGPVRAGGDDGEPLKLLHYRWLGRQYFVARNQHGYERLSARNRASGWGHALHPGYSGDHSVEWFEQQLLRARRCV